MILDVNSPLVGEAVTSFEPWKSYYSAYLNHTFAVVEAFGNYPNTLLFFSGNEVINKIDTAKYVPPYLRAVTRDLKNYIKNNLKRQIPVGYSAADVRDVLADTWNYLQCAIKDETNDMSRADVFALNSYSWCGIDATYKSSSFSNLTDMFKDSSVPVFFSEYGCNTPAPRYWNETKAIYGDEMTPVFAGGVVYEWTQEDNDYGLVTIKGDTVTIMSDYNRLKARWSGIDWKSIQTQSSNNKTVTPPQCESNLILEHGFNNNFTLPEVPPGAQKLIDDGISPKPSGKIIKISDFNVKMTVKDSDGKTMSSLKVVQLSDDEFNWAGKNMAETGSSNSSSSSNSTGNGNTGNGGAGKSGSKEDAGVLIRPMMWAAVLPLVAVLFA